MIRAYRLEVKPDGRQVGADDGSAVPDKRLPALDKM